MIGQKRNKGKIYDHQILIAEDEDETSYESQTFATEDITEEEYFDHLLQEADEDAALIADYEAAMAETFQTDEDLAAAFTSYSEARKRLLLSAVTRPRNKSLHPKRLPKCHQWKESQVKWFCRTYGDSQKEEHRKVLIYIEKMVQQHEIDQGLPALSSTERQQGMVQPRCKGHPKAKASPVPMTHLTEDGMIVMSEEIEDPWDVMGQVYTRTPLETQRQEEIQALQSRVLSMESTLTEILGLLRRNQ
eukprot:s1537_g10.t1